VVVRPEEGEVGSSLPAAAVDGAALYYIVSVRSNVFGLEKSDKLIRCARPEEGAAVTIASISGDRISGAPRFMDLVLSRDGQWLAFPLVDGGTTNIWLLPTGGGPMKQVTDYGGRATEIARSLAWSADGRSVYAAIAELDADIVLFDGLIRA
jgi:Tol biopolymer transport system component